MFKDYTLLLDDTNVNGTGAFRRLFDFELDILTFIQVFEIAIGDTAPMEKYLSPIRSIDKTESSITNQFLDFAGLHSIPLFWIKAFGPAMTAGPLQFQVIISPHL